MLDYYLWLHANPLYMPKYYFNITSSESRIKELCKRVESLQNYNMYLSKELAEVIRRLDKIEGVKNDDL